MVTINPQPVEYYKCSSCKDNVEIGTTHICKGLLSAPTKDVVQFDRATVMELREALLSMNNSLEKLLGIFPTTSEIRREYKKNKLKEIDR